MKSSKRGVGRGEREGGKDFERRGKRRRDVKGRKTVRHTYVVWER